jgi:hypothetical protein
VKLLKQLELFLLPEEHSEADDGSVDEETASDAHDHGLDADLFGVSQHNGKSCDGVLVPTCAFLYGEVQRTNSHYDEESSHESSQFDDTAATRVHKVIV